MFCRNCGTKIPEDSTYCYHCGVKTQNDIQSDSLTNTSSLKENSSDTIQKCAACVKDTKKFLNTRKLVIILCVVLGCLSLIFFTRSRHTDVTVIEGISLGMTKDAVKKAENNNGGEYKGLYVVPSKVFHGVPCGFTYFFDSENLLTGVSITSSEKNYKTYLDLFEELHSLYGDPKYITDELSDSYPLQRIYWEFEESCLCLMYSKNTNNDVQTISMVYDASFQEYTDTVNVVFRSERQCSAAKAVGGCEYNALSWSDYCASHSCNIIGCNEYVFSDRIEKFSLCLPHFKDAIIGNIYVGYIDLETFEEYIWMLY